MNHDDFVKLSFKKQAEKFATYHMSKVEYTDYLIRKLGQKGMSMCQRQLQEPVFVEEHWLLL